MKTLSTLVIVLFSSMMFGQQIVHWVGGTPGKPTEWNEPRNWVPNKVPNEFSHVIIKEMCNGHEAMPVIQDEVFVESIEIIGDASLDILADGSLTFDGMHFLEGKVTLTSRIMAGPVSGSYAIIASEPDSDSGMKVVRTGNTPF